MRSPGSTHGSSSTLPDRRRTGVPLRPERIRTLVAGRALRVLTGPRLPGRRFIYSVTARPALKIADSVLGGRLLEDVAEFLLDLSAIYPGVVRQSREVEALFASAAIVAVTTPDPGPIAEVRRVITERIGVTDDPGTVVFNRVLPRTGCMLRPESPARWPATSPAGLPKRAGTTLCVGRSRRTPASSRWSYRGLQRPRRLPRVWLTWSRRPVWSAEDGVGAEKCPQVGVQRGVVQLRAGPRSAPPWSSPRSRGARRPAPSPDGRRGSHAADPRDPPTSWQREP